MTLKEWLAKYDPSRDYLHVEIGKAVHIYRANRKAKAQLFRLSDYVVSSAVSGPAYVLVKRV